MKLTITRALVELKHINDKISRAISEGTFTGFSVGENEHQKYFKSTAKSTAISKAELESSIQGSFDAVNSLIARRQKLKAAIILSNAKTEVTLGGNLITVAEAIEQKAMIPVLSLYLARLRQDKASSTSQVEQSNMKLEDKIQELTLAAVGAEKGTKLDQGMLDAIAQSQNSRQISALVGATKSQKEIDKLVETLVQLQSELDFVLSESNAQTSIEV